MRSAQAPEKHLGYYEKINLLEILFVCLDYIF